MNTYNILNNTINNIPTEINYSFYNDYFSKLDYISIIIFSYTSYIIIHHIIFIITNSRLEIVKVEREDLIYINKCCA